MIQWFERNPIWSLFIIIMAVFLIHLSVPPVTIMEARNFITAREMIQDNHWILTTMEGEPRYQKPPLPTWFSAISCLVFGVSTWAMRFPAILMFFLTTIFAYYFSLRLNFSKKSSFNNALITMTSFYVIAIIFEGTWDIYAHGFIFGASYFLYNNFQSGTKKNLIYATILSAFSVLSKGPVGVFALWIPFLIAYYIVYKPKFYFFLNKEMGLYILLFLVLGSSWFIYVRIQDPEVFLKITKMETSNWKSYNVKPFYYYWSFFIQSGIWVIFAFIGLCYPYLKDKVLHKKEYKFTFWWVILSVLLLSCVPEKKPRYLMPVLLPLALNTGFYIDYLIRKFTFNWSWKEKLPVFLGFGTLILLAVGGAIYLNVFFISENEILFWLIGLFLYVAIISYFMIRKFIELKLNQVVHYFTALFLGLLFFSMPFLPYFYVNMKAKNSIEILGSIREKESINVYKYGFISPEMAYAYNGLIPNIREDENQFTYPKAKFGILVSSENELEFIINFCKNYRIKYYTTFNHNFFKSERGRLKRKLFIVEKMH